MSKKFSHIGQAFSQLGQAFMLPIAILPVAGLLLGLGGALTKLPSPLILGLINNGFKPF